MNYEQLDQADLSGLEQAATDWRSVTSAYEGLGDEYDHQVRRRLERSWEGEAAAAARSEIFQVKKQMDAAAGEVGHGEATGRRPSRPPQVPEAAPHALERGGKWAEALISVGGAAVGGGAGGPAGAAIGAAAGAEVAKLAVGEVTGAAQDTTIESSDDAARGYAKAEEASHDNIWKTMKGADVEPPAGMTMDEWRLAIERGVSDGYRDAHSNVDMYATNRPEGS